MCRLARYLHAAPVLLVLGVFMRGAVLDSLRLSAHRWGFLNPLPVFMGLDTFRIMLTIAQFRNAVWTTALLAIPVTLYEAARTDRAGAWTIIVLRSRHAISVVALFAIMGNWNELAWPLLTTTSEDMRTVQIGLRYLLRNEGEGASPDRPLVLAGTMITRRPRLVVSIFAERHLIRGIAMGSLR
jgi:ABC-type glycerol-3-phosphate transport system permease component